MNILEDRRIDSRASFESYLRGPWKGYLVLIFKHSLQLSIYKRRLQRFHNRWDECEKCVWMLVGFRRSCSVDGSKHFGRIRHSIEMAWMLWLWITTTWPNKLQFARSLNAVFLDLNHKHCPNRMDNHTISKAWIRNRIFKPAPHNSHEYSPIREKHPKAHLRRATQRLLCSEGNCDGCEDPLPKVSATSSIDNK